MDGPQELPSVSRIVCDYGRGCISLQISRWETTTYKVLRLEIIASEAGGMWAAQISERGGKDESEIQRTYLGIYKLD